MYFIWIVSNIIDIPFTLTRLQAVKDSDNDRMRFVVTPYILFILISITLAPLNIPRDVISILEYTLSKSNRTKYKTFHNFFYKEVRREYEDD
jgi:hypothetical protein